MTGIQIHGVWGGYLGLFPGGIGKQGLEAAEQETMSSDPHRAVSLKVWGLLSEAIEGTENQSLKV